MKGTTYSTGKTELSEYATPVVQRFHISRRHDVCPCPKWIRGDDVKSAAENCICEREGCHGDGDTIKLIAQMPLYEQRKRQRSLL